MKLALLKTTVDVVLAIPKTYGDAGGMLSAAHALEKKANQQSFPKLLWDIKFLARQGISLLGDVKEKDRNFL